MAYDKGLRSLGRRFYVGTLRSAHNVQDNGFGAFVLAKMDIHVSNAGDTAARVRLIETALAPLPTSSPGTSTSGSPNNRLGADHPLAATLLGEGPTPSPGWASLAPTCGWYASGIGTGATARGTLS